MDDFFEGIGRKARKEVDVDPIAGENINASTIDTVAYENAHERTFKDQALRFRAVVQKL